MKIFLRWLFSQSLHENQHTNEKERLENTMKTTAISRYNASVRLKIQGKIAFVTTTILSLGLILMPLIQVADIPLIFSSNILSVIQIFLAVSVLVYSIIIGTARYDLRSEQLNDCGDKIKALIRELRTYKDSDTDSIKEIQKRYSDIATSVENHARNDYLLTTLRTRELYTITGIIRVLMWLKYYGINLILNLIPFFLLSIEIIFILDMFAATNVFAPYLLGSYIKN